MADEQQSGQERTEEPTERRKQEARRKGQVPRSKELNTTITLLAAAASLLTLGPAMVEGMLQLATEAFSADRELTFNAVHLPVHFMHMMSTALLLLAPFLLVSLVAAFAGPLLMGGWAFSAESMSFSFDKINPVKGLARVFSLKGLLELAKALLKFLLILAVTFALFGLLQRDILQLSSLAPGAASQSTAALLAWSLLLLSASMALIALFDVPFELWDFHRKLRMTRQEVRDEMKETDGRPEIKQRIRTLQREVAQRRMMSDIPTADVVITNPTHYAVAIAYSAEGTGAPRVVAKGRDLIALQIRSVAGAHQVPLFEAPLLARALYASTEIGAEIPRGLYLAVARVLAYLFQLRRAGPTDYVPRPTALEIPPEYEDLMDEDAADGD
jgi:flagellar biosynthetic protein FlhB